MSKFVFALSLVISLPVSALTCHEMTVFANALMGAVQYNIPRHKVEEIINQGKEPDKPSLRVIAEQAYKKPIGKTSAEKDLFTIQFAAETKRACDLSKKL